MITRRTPARIVAAAAAAGALGLSTLAVSPAVAQTAPAPPPALETSLMVDGTITAAALAATGLAALVAVDTGTRWRRELLPFDEPVKANFSSGAARASDLLVTLAVVTPLVLQAGQGLDEAAGRRALVYGETIAATLALGAVTKALVGRPRPYVYNPDPRVEAYARREARDSHLSFFSGHAATAFAAAVGGSFLFTQSSDDVAARTAAWATGLFLAGATSNLRVRAGKHFYSDVIAGAVLGAAVGLAVPLLHYRGADVRGPETAEWLAIAAAPVAGVIVSQLIPVRPDIVEPLSVRPATARIVPWIAGGGGGLMLARTF